MMMREWEEEGKGKEVRIKGKDIYQEANEIVQEKIDEALHLQGTSFLSLGVISLNMNQ